MKPREASKPYIRAHLQEPGAPVPTLWGALFGLVFAGVGTLGLMHWRGVERYVLGLPFALVGYLALAGAWGHTRLTLTPTGLVLSYRLWGRVPVFRRTLVQAHEIQGLRHIRREASYVTAAGARLDEHFLVLASTQPREYVVHDLGRHPAAQAAFIATQAAAWAGQHAMPLAHERDGESAP